MFKKIRILSFIVICFSSNLFGYFPINLFRRYDFNFEIDRVNDERFQLAGLAGGSVHVNGRNHNGDDVSFLQIFNKDQSALTMLRGFDLDTEIGQLAALFTPQNDDGIRGHILPVADLSVVDAGVMSKFYLPQDFFISFYLPIYSMKFTNLELIDQTQSISPLDFKVKDLLTDNFASVVKSLGGPIIEPWQKTGIGDLVGVLQWTKNFVQSKPLLKNVRINARVGGTFPTGYKPGLDQFFPIPFGNDGSWGILFGGSLGLLWTEHLKGGVDVEFLQIFSHTKERRIKTDKSQMNDLVFLAKADSILEPGFMQNYNLYIEARKLFRGLSFRVAYQHIAQNESRIALLTNEFSTQIANTAESLQCWSINQLILDLSYDWTIDGNQCERCVNPYLSLYYKLPFGGKNSVQMHIAGVALSFNF